METKIKLPMAVLAGVMIGVGIGGGVARARAPRETAELRESTVKRLTTSSKRD